ncbi:transposase, partial [Porphyromonas gingivalis]|uniref:transposase n=1 Tax=Porphyromonas gingivalis TaxID=837 RepID=UPI00333F0902
MRITRSKGEESKWPIILCCVRLRMKREKERKMKGNRREALTEVEKQQNKAISRIRSTIERTFGSIRRWFHGGRCRYRGLAKTHTQNILESIAFNL